MQILRLSNIVFAMMYFRMEKLRGVRRASERSLSAATSPQISSPRNQCAPGQQPHRRIFPSTSISGGIWSRTLVTDKPDFLIGSAVPSTRAMLGTGSVAFRHYFPRFSAHDYVSRDAEMSDHEVEASEASPAPRRSARAAKKVVPTPSKRKTLEDDEENAEEHSESEQDSAEESDAEEPLPRKRKARGDKGAGAASKKPRSEVESQSAEPETRRQGPLAVNSVTNGLLTAYSAAAKPASARSQPNRKGVSFKSTLRVSVQCMMLTFRKPRTVSMARAFLKWLPTARAVSMRRQRIGMERTARTKLQLPASYSTSCSK